MFIFSDDEVKTIERLIDFSISVGHPDKDPMWDAPFHYLKRRVENRDLERNDLLMLQGFLSAYCGNIPSADETSRRECSDLLAHIKEYLSRTKQ